MSEVPGQSGSALPIILVISCDTACPWETTIIECEIDGLPALKSPEGSKLLSCRGCSGVLAIGVDIASMKRTEARPHPLRLHAKDVSVGESGDQYFQVSFDSEAASGDDFDESAPDHPYLIVQRQFEDDDGGVCYIETHDHDTYTGHFRLRLIEFTPTRLAFEIARTDHRYVEVTYDLDAQRFGDVQPIVNIIFGVQS